MEIRDLGVIRSLQLPEGWLELDSPQQPDLESVRRFGRPPDHQVQLQVIARGRRFPPATGDRLRHSLDSAPHVLDSREWQALTPLLGFLADETLFAVDSASTLDVQGRRVLSVEGMWKAQQLFARVLFVDADGSGQVIQELVWLAPADERQRRLDEYLQVIRSLQWKA